MKGFGFRGAGRRGMAGRSYPHPSKKKSIPKAKKVTGGTFGFRGANKGTS